VIVPIHNDEPALWELHFRLRSALDVVEAERGLDAEIVAVNDGSRDASLPLLWRLVAEDPLLRVVDLLPRRGEPEALLRGLENTQASLLITLEADPGSRPEEVPLVVDGLLAGHDLVVSGSAGLRGYRRELVERILAASRCGGSGAPSLPALSSKFARSPLDIEVAQPRSRSGARRWCFRDLLRRPARLLSALVAGWRRPGR
jgi:glycosyltransferase involved in cell wall biosynthesis